MKSSKSAVLDCTLRDGSYENNFGFTKKNTFDICKSLEKAGVKTNVGLLKDECKELNRVFFVNQKKSRPYVILKSAQSIDGKIALKNGDSKWISNPESRKDSHHLRSSVKGILVGRMTAEGDNPSLTIRLSKKELNLNKSDSIELITRFDPGSVAEENQSTRRPSAAIRYLWKFQRGIAIDPISSRAHL